MLVFPEFWSFDFGLFNVESLYLYYTVMSSIRSCDFRGVAILTPVIILSLSFKINQDCVPIFRSQLLLVKKFWFLSQNAQKNLFTESLLRLQSFNYTDIGRL